MLKTYFFKKILKNKNENNNCMKVNKNLKSYENSCSSKKDSKSEYSIKQMEASFH